MMKTYDLYWSPEGRKIATVKALTMRAAIRKAPKPHRRYLGEIYAKEVESLLPVGYAELVSSETAYGQTIGYSFALKVF